MRYNYLLFDLDGTLVDTTEGVLKSAQVALNNFGINVELDELMNFFGPPLKYSFTKLYGLSDSEADEAIEIYKERYDRVGCSESVVFPEIPDLLYCLKNAGYVLGVATSKPQDQAIAMLGHHSLLRYFDAVSGANEDGSISTKDQVIEEALNLLGVTDQRNVVLMIGDMKYDIIGAKKAGIDSFGIYTGTASENELENAGADNVAYNFSELRSKLLDDFSN